MKEIHSKMSNNSLFFSFCMCSISFKYIVFFGKKTNFLFWPKWQKINNKKINFFSVFLCFFDLRVGDQLLSLRLESKARNKQRKIRGGPKAKESRAKETLWSLNQIDLDKIQRVCVCTRLSVCLWVCVFQRKRTRRTSNIHRFWIAIWSEVTRKSNDSQIVKVMWAWSSFWRNVVVAVLRVLSSRNILQHHLY